MGKLVGASCLLLFERRPWLCGLGEEEDCCKVGEIEEAVDAEEFVSEGHHVRNQVAHCQQHLDSGRRSRWKSTFGCGYLVSWQCNCGIGHRH